MDILQSMPFDWRSGWFTFIREHGREETEKKYFFRSKRGKKRDCRSMGEYNLKKDSIRRAERALAELTDKHEKSQDELNKIELDSGTPGHYWNNF